MPTTHTDRSDSTEPAPRRGRGVMVAGFAVAVLIALAMVAVARRDRGKPPPDEDPTRAAQAAVARASDKLRALHWLDFRDVTADELDRRLRLLDGGIYAVDAYAGAVNRLDPKVPANEEAYRLRDIYAARGEVFRAGRDMIAVLREHHGRWQYDPAGLRIQFQDDALIAPFAAKQDELQVAVARYQAVAASIETTSATAPAATGPTTLPTPTRLPPATGPTTGPGTQPAAPESP